MRRRLQLVSDGNHILTLDEAAGVLARRDVREGDIALCDAKERDPSTDDHRNAGGHRLLPAIVPKHELVEIDLELRPAHSVVGADQPLLEVADGAVSQWAPPI